LFNGREGYTAWRRALSLALALVTLCSLAAPAFGFEIAVVMTKSVYEAGELTGGNDTYRVSVAYGEEARIPENAALFTEELTETGLYRAAAERMLPGDRTAVGARFFDIEIRDGDGTKLEPETPVSVTISAEGIDSADGVTVVHFPEHEDADPGDSGVEALTEQNAVLSVLSSAAADFEIFDGTDSSAPAGLPETELVDAEIGEDGRITFEADGFSVYGVVWTRTLVTEVLTDGGELFEVTVTYDETAGLPGDAALRVTEFAEGSPEYADAWKTVTGEDYVDPSAEESEDGRTFRIAGEQSFLPAGMAALDISIFDGEGQKLEPAVPVQVSVVMKSLPESFENGEGEAAVAVRHLRETPDGVTVETVASADGSVGEVTVEETSLAAEFTVDGFSTYTITWGSAASNTGTNLQFRSNNTNRVTVPVYYVDTAGNPIPRPSGIGGTVNVNMNAFPYTYNITSSDLAQSIDGFTYQGAHSGSYTGSEVSSVTVTRTQSGWYYTYSADVSSLYLVYSGQQPSSGITVHYGYMNGNDFVEFTEDEDGNVPAGTTVPKPAQLGDQWDLEMEIPNYRYVTTRLNNPQNGREISPLLNTDPPYKANTNNTFENADQSAYPSYNASVAPTPFGSEWRYRQLSSIGWNPTGGGWNYSNTEPVTGYGVTKPVLFAQTDQDIYVIYEKGSMVGGSPQGDPPDPGTLNAPDTDKQVNSNGDGTYDVTLSATSERKDASATSKANVIIVLDTSWSMYEKDAGGGQSRMTVAKSAIGSLADKLFALNAAESDTVELAFVTFAQRVRNEEEMRRIYSGTDATEFKNMVNGLDCASGTNWDDALYAADHIYFNDNDPTYVVFITDGDPISCAHPYGKYDDWDGGTYYTGRTDYEYALAAKNQADLIIAHNKTLYTIGAFGSVANLQAIGGTYLGQANDTTTINGYFDDIISEIRSSLGYQDIVINDGITALSSTGLARGDISSLRYYRSGGTNPNGSEKYDHTANNGHGVEWTDAPAAYLLEVKEENGTVKYYKNGTETALDSLTSLTETEYLAKYPAGTRTVIWDINPNSEDLMEDGVTYTMIFTMWPSQDAYDLVANLNNGVVNYDELSQAERDQVYLENGVYYLKTNTSASVDYTTVRMVNGQASGDPVPATAPIEDPKGKMNLDKNEISVRKEFAHLINEADPYEEIVFYVLVDGKYYNKDGTLSDTLDEENVYSIRLPDASAEEGKKWEGKLSIAPGLMRGGKILETGHNYTLVEKIVSGNPYEYEFSAQTLRPMVITAVPTFLVLEDDENPNTENTQEYTLNDEEHTYTAGPSDEEGTYYVMPQNKGSLTGVNHKTSELDITKIIHDPDDLITDAEEAADTFTYRVTLEIPDGKDPSGIVGYEYVPRTQANAFTLFGYQTGQSAFPEDIARFNGKTYRAWNTLVYDALIEYDRVTKNGKTSIVARRDADGNIIWKIPAVDGYHTITYDMTLKQDEVIRFTNLPTGTKYTIQEIYANKYPADNAGGKTDGRAPVSDESNLSAEGYEIEKVQHTGGTLSADKSTVTGTIEAPDTRYYNQFTNTKTKKDDTVRAELRVKKVVEGYEWGEEYYRFTLTAGTASYTDAEGGEGTSPMPDGGANSAVSVYDSTADHTLSFGLIRYERPGVYTYTVSEYDNTKNMPYVLFAAPVTVTVTVTADEDGKLTVESIEDDADTTEFTAETASALASGLTTQTNKSRTVTIRKVDRQNTDTVLSGAVFELRQGNDLFYLRDGKLLRADAVVEIIGMSLSDDGADRAMEAAGISSSITLGELELALSELQFDTVYELREITPPDGYIITNKHVYFKVVREEARVYLCLTDETGAVLENEDGPVTDNSAAVIAEGRELVISVKNEAGAALPNTGGIGTGLFTLLGTVLTLGAGLILLRRAKCRG